MESQTMPKQQIFNDHERDVTGYLFAKLLVLYAGQFYLVYPSVKEVNFAKREYAKQIGVYSRDQVDTAIKLLASLMVSSERQNKIYREPNLPVILALMEEALKCNRAHQKFLPIPQEPEEERIARLQAGMKETAKLLAMLDEEGQTVKLSQQEIADNERL
jgi:hypothetical protein